MGEERQHEEQNKVLESNEEPPKVSENEAKVIDFTNLKATDLKNNKRIIIPNLNNDDEHEIRRNTVKIELEKVFVNYVKDHCDKFGNVIDNNLSEEQLKAIKSIKEKMKKEDLGFF